MAVVTAVQSVVVFLLTSSGEMELMYYGSTVSQRQMGSIKNLIKSSCNQPVCVWGYTNACFTMYCKFVWNLNERYLPSSLHLQLRHRDSSVLLEQLWWDTFSLGDSGASLSTAWAGS